MSRYGVDKAMREIVLMGEEAFKAYAYQPECLGSTDNIVHRRLTDDDILELGLDGYYTVKEALDALLCKLRAKHSEQPIIFLM